MILELACSAAAFVSAVSLGAREATLSPASTTFPGAPRLVRIPLFVSCGVYLVVSWEFFEHAWGRGHFAGAAEYLAFAAILGSAMTNVAMLANVMGQRYTPEVWAKIRRYEQRLIATTPRAHLNPLGKPVRRAA